MAILGGAKVTDKIGVITNLIEKVDTLHHRRRHGLHLHEGAPGGEIGNSLCDEERTRPGARSMLDKAKAKGVKLLLPVDNVLRQGV